MKMKLLIRKLFTINHSIIGVNCLHRHKSTHVYKYGGKLRQYEDLCDIYLLQRNVNQNINEHKFNELIVDQKSKQSVNYVLDIYSSLKTDEQLYPSDITVEDMKILLNKNEDLKYILKKLKYLFVCEFDSWRKNIEKLNRKAERLRLEEMTKPFKIGVFDDSNQLQYGYYRNTMFSKHFEGSHAKYSFHRLRNATVFGQKLVMDCSFDEQMAEHEIGSCARQLARIYSYNRYSDLPYDLHFCNLNPNSRIAKYLEKAFNRTLDKSKSFMNLHEQSYLELFSDQKLVYLTPHARRTITEYDHNAVYILGALVGKSCKYPLTGFKSNYEGLERYRLPIHLYVKLKPCVRRVLSHQGVFSILLEMKQNPDWKLAFGKGIQEHKLMDDEEDNDDYDDEYTDSESPERQQLDI